MAMISLSDASLLSPSRIPHSTAMGIVTLNRLGSVKRKTSATSVSVELLRTTTSRMCGSSGMNRMKVKSAHPISVSVRISPRMYRVRMRTNRTCAQFTVSFPSVRAHHLVASS